jgi:hypothetical protein
VMLNFRSEGENIRLRNFALQALLGDFIGGAEGDRTPDLMTASHALSHLSYSPLCSIILHKKLLLSIKYYFFSKYLIHF